MKYRTLWIKVQSHSVVKNLQQQWHTVLTMVTNLFLSLLIRLAILSPCIGLQYFLDDEFHMSCHSCAIPSLTSPWVSCKVSAFPNSNPLNLNFLIPTPSLLFMMYFQPWVRQQSVTSSSLFDFNSFPPWKKKPSAPTATNLPRLGSFLQRSKRRLHWGDTVIYFQHLPYLLLYFLIPVHQPK